jgi:hypothetical protein
MDHGKGSSRRFVICGGMYRSCSTWQYEVAAHLLEAAGLGRRLGYLSGWAFQRWDAASGETGRFVFKSHEESPFLARALRAGRAVGLYSYRDPRDVVYSMLHKRGQSFDEFVGQGMVHQILANDRFWRARPGILIQRYDDLIADPAEGVRSIAEFLGIRVDIEAVRQIAGAYSQDANRQRARRLQEQLVRSGVDLADPDSHARRDDRTLLHWNHFRSPDARSWREIATSRERAILQRLLGAWLIRQGFATDRPEGSITPPTGPDHLLLAKARWNSLRQRFALHTPRAHAWLKGRLPFSQGNRQPDPFA